MWGNWKDKMVYPTYVIVGKARIKLLLIMQVSGTRLFQMLNWWISWNLYSLFFPRKKNHLTFYWMLITYQTPPCKIFSCFYLLHEYLSRDIYVQPLCLLDCRQVKDGSCPHGVYMWICVRVCMCMCVWQRMKVGSERRTISR